MIQIGVKTLGFKEARGILRTVSKQMPFATAKALTVTAKDVRDEVVAEIPKHLNEPVRFTRRAFGYKSATKRRLEAKVFAKSIQAQYLWWSIEGGTESSMIRPANMKLNKYGNMPRKKIEKLMARPDVFYGTVKGITGVWQRGKWRGSRFYSGVTKSKWGYLNKRAYEGRNPYRGLKLLAVYESTLKFKKKFDFHGISQRVMDERWPGNLEEAWRLALATAR